MASTIKIHLLQFVLIEIKDAFSQGKIGSLIGIEGGHSIGSSLAMLRMMYSMGVRYMTLTHSCPTPWYKSRFKVVSRGCIYPA